MNILHCLQNVGFLIFGSEGKMFEIHTLDQLKTGEDYQSMQKNVFMKKEYLNLTLFSADEEKRLEYEE